MTWRNNVCNKKPHNCRNGDSCRDTQECCFERDTPSGHKGTHGTCVAKGSCNFRTGIPTNSAKIPCDSENYTEGYSGSGSGSNSFKEWKLAVGIMGVLILLLAILLIFLGLKKKN